MRKLVALLSFLLALIFPAGALAVSTPITIGNQNVFSHVLPVNGSGVQGLVDLRQVRKGGGGTQINLIAFGLQPGWTPLT